MTPQEAQSWRERLWELISEWSSIEEFDYSEEEAERLHLEAAKEIDEFVAGIEAAARQEGISIQAQLCKEQKEIVRKEALEEAAKIAEDYADLKKGHGIEAFDTSEAIAQRIRTSLTE